MKKSPDGYPYAERILNHLWGYAAEQSDLKFYAILDGARSEKIYPALKEYSVNHKCLFLSHKLLFHQANRCQSEYSGIESLFPDLLQFPEPGAQQPFL